MSIIIKGMAMPKNCWECCLSDIDDDFGRCCLYSGIACLTIGRQDNCPLVEISTPHGRLGDLDELKTAFPICDNSMDIKIASVRATINHAPTVIEAEGSET